MKMCIWRCHRDLGWKANTRFVDYLSHCIDLNKHLDSGTSSLLQHYQRQDSCRVLMTILCLLGKGIVEWL